MEKLGEHAVVIGASVAGLLAARVLAERYDALRIDPRDAKLQRALARTYVRPAQTQELAADALGLPFSTYRRHLT